MGFTGQPVKTRWGQHVRRAAKNATHPLGAAIRKYGAANFIVEELELFECAEEALLAEQVTIAAEVNPYNISAGGERDFEAAHVRFKELLADPTWRAAYCKRLSESIRNSEAHARHCANLAAISAEWRKANPKEAYFLSRRALRMAQPGGQRAPEQGRLKPIGKAAKKYRSLNHAAAARKHWQEMPEELRERTTSKISASVEAHYAALDTETRAGREAQLAEARKSIDHDKRKSRQREALAAYWTPERRAEASAKRKGKPRTASKK